MLRGSAIFGQVDAGELYMLCLDQIILAQSVLGDCEQRETLLACLFDTHVEHIGGNPATSKKSLRIPNLTYLVCPRVILCRFLLVFLTFFDTVGVL